MISKLGDEVLFDNMEVCTGGPRGFGCTAQMLDQILCRCAEAYSFVIFPFL
jgi:hypothetical protein